jgi:GNAT superfamily N-acetyltransferase
MESKTIQVDGIPTVIRPMGEDYVAGDDPDVAGVTYAVKCWPGKHVKGQWPNPEIAAYFRKVMDAYGTSAIMAWQERTLVGVLPFMPVNCGLPKMSFCICAPDGEQTPLERIARAQAIPFAELSPRVIYTECLSVNWGLYRRGIGSAMAQYLVEWASEQGWDRIEGVTFATPDGDDAYRWIPSIQFWEKAGFQCGDAHSFGDDMPPGVRFFADLKHD